MKYRRISITMKSISLAILNISNNRFTNLIENAISFYKNVFLFYFVNFLYLKLCKLIKFANYHNFIIYSILKPFNYKSNKQSQHDCTLTAASYDESLTSVDERFLNADNMLPLDEFNDLSLHGSITSIYR